MRRPMPFHVINTQGRRFLVRLSQLRFSPIEMRDLLKSWAIISLAFSIALSGLHINLLFFVLMAVSAVTVGLGFLLHELAHKAVAVHFGLWAEYRSFDTMLLVSLIASLFGILFAAPGAVFITPRTRGWGLIPVSTNGKISAAGPLMNFMLAVGFLALAITLPVLEQLALWGAQINAWLGLFNMIPILNLDGSKIWAWSKPVFWSLGAIGVGLMVAVSALG